MFPKEVRWEYQILKKVELKEKTSKAEHTWLCISADGTKLHVKKKKRELLDVELSKPGSWGQRLKDKYLLRERVSAKVKNTCILRLHVLKSKVLLQVFQWIQPLTHEGNQHHHEYFYKIPGVMSQHVITCGPWTTSQRLNTSWVPNQLCTSSEWTHGGSWTPASSQHRKLIF